MKKVEETVRKIVVKEEMIVMVVMMMIGIGVDVE